MRRLLLTAILAVPLLLIDSERADANPPPGIANFGCAGYCFKLFPHIHQHGPLYNYGPYYGYYPFAPYGPWDAYLRYDPNFYGDAGAGHGGAYGPNTYGINPRLFPHLQALAHHDWHSHGGFFHASWLQGGWFRGHKWLDGGHGCHAKCGDSATCHAQCDRSEGCTSCGGVAVAPAVNAGRDPVAKYSGFGTPSQSSVFYAATPTLNPAAVAPAK